MVNVSGIEATTALGAPNAVDGPVSVGGDIYNGFFHFLGFGLGHLGEALALGGDDLPVAVTDHLLLLLEEKKQVPD